jgi:hypothetical protein
MKRKPTKVIKNVFEADFSKVICGVYRITSPTGAIYIGEAQNIKNRWDTYRYYDCHSQKMLYSSLKLHGWESHSYDIIYIVDTGDTDIGFEKHKQVLKAVEEVFTVHYEQQGCKMMNAPKGRTELNDILNTIVKPRRVTPLFEYDIIHKHTREIFKTNSLSQFIIEHSLKSGSRLSNTLYGFESDGYSCEYANEFKILSKHCVNSVEQDIELQRKINDTKFERIKVRTKLLENLTKKLPNSTLTRASIYKYEILKIKDNITYETTELSKFCKEHNLIESGLIGTLYAIDARGNRVTQHNGYVILSKKYIDERFDNNEITNVIEDIKRKREDIRKKSNKNDSGSDKLKLIIRENSMKYIYTIKNVDTEEIYETHDLQTFIENYLPKNIATYKGSLVDTLYGCDAIGMPRLSYKGFKIISKLYKDSNRNNTKLIKTIEETRQRRFNKRIEAVKNINRKMFKITNVVTNETFIVTNFKRFCKERGLGVATLIEQYEGRLLGKNLAPHRDYIVTDRFWSNNPENNHL